MQNAPVDIVVIGEGEFSCVAALDALRDGRDLNDILGIAYRDPSGKIIKNSPRPACDMNELPITDWSFFDVPEYLKRYQWTAFGVPKEEKSVTPRRMEIHTPETELEIEMDTETG